MLGNFWGIADLLFLSLEKGEASLSDASVTQSAIEITYFSDCSPIQED